MLALCQNIGCMCVDSVCLIMASVLSPVTHTLVLTIRLCLHTHSTNTAGAVATENRVPVHGRHEVCLAEAVDGTGLSLYQLF